MSILDSIEKARSRGANDDVILQNIIQSNPNKGASFQQAQQRGAGSSQIIEEIMKQNQQSAQTSSTQPRGFSPQPEQSLFRSNLRSSFAERRKRLEAGKERVRTGGQSRVESILQFAGESVGGAFDIAIEGLRAVTPDKLEEAVKKRASELFPDFATSPIGRTINFGAEKFEDLSPRTQDNFRATIELLSLVPIGKGISKTIEATAPIVKKTVQRTSQLGKDLIKVSREKIRDIPKIIRTRAERTATSNLQKFISPSLTPTKATEAIKTKGVILGRTKKVGLDFSKDPRVIRGAEALDGIVDPNKTFTEGIIKSSNAIEDISVNRIEPFLSENPVPFNFGDLRKSFELVTPKSSLKADPSAFKNYTRVRENILTDIETFLKRKSDRGRITDFNDVWDARKVVDDIISDELGTKVLGTPEFTGVKAAAQDIRAAFSDFIVDSFKFPGQLEKVNRMKEFIKVARKRGIIINNPEEALELMGQLGIDIVDENLARAAFFQDSMEELTAMFSAIDNMAPSARKEIGTTQLGRFLKTPLGKATKIGVGGAIAGAGFTAASGFVE